MRPPLSAMLSACFSRLPAASGAAPLSSSPSSLSRNHRVVGVVAAAAHASDPRSRRRIPHNVNIPRPATMTADAAASRVQPHLTRHPSPLPRSGLPRSPSPRGASLRTPAAGPSLAAGLAAPLISPTDQWGMWAAILCASSFGLWGDKQKWGAAMGGSSLLSTLMALFLSNVGVMPTVSPAYGVVNKFLLPLAVPLLLLTADMRRVLTATGRVLWCFFVGAVGTTIGTLVAYTLVPMAGRGSFIPTN